MLGKQGWKLIRAPDALSSRLLKAKYYPKKGFLNATLGSSPSFIWRSIWCSQAILTRGTRWKIGDGKSINIGTYPWLRDPANFYIQRALDEEHRAMTVHELIDVDLHQWKATTLQAIFEKRDIGEIMKIPVPTTASEDIRLWHFSRDGCYTVKSGYRLLMTNIANSNSAQHAPGLWNRMWTVHVPPKACWEAVNMVHLVNDKNAAERSPRVNIKLAVDLLNNWIEARKSPRATHSQMNAPEEELTWKRPPTGFMKCNVDAAIFRETRLIGYAAVVRDSKGEFMVCRMLKFQGSIEVREAEAKALLDAITWAASLDMQHIIFETDSKTVEEAVHSNAVDRNELGTIIEECCSLLSRERYYKVHFTRR
ncbi:uncharacterized protein LOC142538416 [Primulina tabacum]|uniref:uncharacterized protein LOC142538416 n=1 Tax=Primulina tabacum TaxID=48773 RepID=UPI003F5ABA8E